MRWLRLDIVAKISKTFNLRWNFGRRLNLWNLIGVAAYHRTAAKLRHFMHTYIFNYFIICSLPRVFRIPIPLSPFPFPPFRPAAVKGLQLQQYNTQASTTRYAGLPAEPTHVVSTNSPHALWMLGAAVGRARATNSCGRQDEGSHSRRAENDFPNLLELAVL